MEGNGPMFGTTVNGWRKVAAGTDPIELDAICAGMMGQNPNELPYLVKASRYLGRFDPNIISEIPPSFIREFALNENVVAWLAAERSHNLRILYLRLAGCMWSRSPKLARALSLLLGTARNLFGRFRR